jgi:hypothetical protein
MAATWAKAKLETLEIHTASDKQPSLGGMLRRHLDGGQLGRNRHRLPGGATVNKTSPCTSSLPAACSCTRARGALLQPAQRSQERTEAISCLKRCLADVV